MGKEKREVDKTDGSSLGCTCSTRSLYQHQHPGGSITPQFCKEELPLVATGTRDLSALFLANVYKSTIISK